MTSHSLRTNFSAPWSRLLRTITWLAVALLVAVVALVVASRAPVAVVLLTVGASVLLIAGTALFGVLGYEVQARTLTIRRPAWRKRFDLATLASVEPDAAAMSGSIRLFANGGLFAFNGLFWNRRLGRYRAEVTDPARSVVLRFADRRPLVVTPDDPTGFVAAVRLAAGLANAPD